MTVVLGWTIHRIDSRLSRLWVFRVYQRSLWAP